MTTVITHSPPLSTFHHIAAYIARACAFYKFSFSSITSITNYVNNLVINMLISDKRVIEGVIEVIEESFLTIIPWLFREF